MPAASPKIVDMAADKKPVLAFTMLVASAEMLSAEKLYVRLSCGECNTRLCPFSVIIEWLHTRAQRFIHRGVTAERHIRGLNKTGRLSHNSSLTASQTSNSSRGCRPSTLGSWKQLCTFLALRISPSQTGLVSHTQLSSKPHRDL